MGFFKQNIYNFTCKTLVVSGSQFLPTAVNTWLRSFSWLPEPDAEILPPVYRGGRIFKHMQPAKGSFADYFHRIFKLRLCFPETHHDISGQKPNQAGGNATRKQCVNNPGQYNGGSYGVKSRHHRFVKAGAGADKFFLLQHEF